MFFHAKLLVRTIEHDSPFPPALSEHQGCTIRPQSPCPIHGDGHHIQTSAERKASPSQQSPAPLCGPPARLLGVLSSSLPGGLAASRAPVLPLPETLSELPDFFFLFSHARPSAVRSNLSPLDVKQTVSRISGPVSFWQQHQR